MTEQSEMEKQVPEIFGTVLYILIFFAIFLAIFFLVADYMGLSFCSTTVMLRSMFNNLFAGWLGRAVIPDWIFGLIPLACPVNVELVSQNAEALIADKILECYNTFGAGRLDGVFPSSSRLCSIILFNPSLGDEFTVDLMNVYTLLVNNTSFDRSKDFNNPGLDDYNFFKLCVKPPYFYNAYRHMFNEYALIGSSIVNPMLGSVGECLGDYDDEGNLIRGECTTTARNSFYSQLLYYRPSTTNSHCLSLREAALNLWQVDLSKTIHNYLSEPVYDSMQDIDLFCNNLCYRNCEAEDLNRYNEFSNCFLFCLTQCSNCGRESCSTINADPVNCEAGGCYDFTSELSNLFKEDDIDTSPESTSLTQLKRGVFYIRFYDYTDWVQQAWGDTYINWYLFPECETTLLYIGGTIRQSNIFFNPQYSHDYVAICYLPYIPYELSHPDEFGDVRDTATIATW